MNKEQNIEVFLKDLHRIHGNAIFFLEEYWNKLHPDKKLELTDEEKQFIYDRNKLMVPVFSDDDSFHRHVQAYEEAKKRGLKDWEIY